MRNINNRNELQAYLRELTVRLERQERHTHLHGVTQIVTVINQAAPPPEPEPACPPCDTFDRDALGDCYAALGTNSDWDELQPFTLVDGHVEWPGDTPFGHMGSGARLVTAAALPHSIELTFSHMPINHWVEPQLFCSLSTDSPVTGVGVYMQLLRDGVTGEDLIYASGYHNSNFDDDDYWGSYGTVTGVGIVGTDFTIRLELDADFTARLYFNDTLLMSGAAGVGVPSSPYVGFFLRKTYYSTVATTDQPFLEQVCVGSASPDPLARRATATRQQRQPGRRRP